MRINKYLAQNLNISRRKADILIENKEIKINGKEALLGQYVKDADVLKYKNKIIRPISYHKYYKFYKPKNYIVSRNIQGETNTIYELISNKNLKYSGRLDKDSEGLMLLSTDGKWLNDYSHPSKNIYKKYLIDTNGEAIDLNIFKTSIKDKKEILKIYSIIEKSKNQYYVTLKTGKNREIRRIFEYNNIKINNLKRLSIGEHKLGNMKIGELKEINL